jgi:hypothetical protein
MFMTTGEPKDHRIFAQNDRLSRKWSEESFPGLSFAIRPIQSGALAPFEPTS